MPKPAKKITRKPIFPTFGRRRALRERAKLESKEKFYNEVDEIVREANPRELGRDAFAAMEHSVSTGTDLL